MTRLLELERTKFEGSIITDSIQEAAYLAGMTSTQAWSIFPASKIHTSVVEETTFAKFGIKCKCGIN